MKVKLILLLLIVAMTTMGFECVNEDAVFSINVQGISGTYVVAQGSQTLAPTSWSFTPSQYLGGDYGDISNVRIYDIRVTTAGAFSGNVSGTITLNNITVLTIANKPWASFSAPGQSLITSTLFSTPNAAAIQAVVQAIKSSQPVVLGMSGALSSAAPAGLSVTVEVLGQVDAGL